MKKLSKNENIGVFFALSIVMVFFLVLPSSLSSIRALLFDDRIDEVESSNNNIQNISEGLIIEDIAEGVGKEARTGDQVMVHYVGRFTNGLIFDSSLAKGIPFTFKLGEGSVIEGWESGIPGMKAGGQRVLIIPPELAYGKEGRGPIPGSATLIFEIELLEILP